MGLVQVVTAKRTPICAAKAGASKRTSTSSKQAPHQVHRPQKDVSTSDRKTKWLTEDSSIYKLMRHCQSLEHGWAQTVPTVIYYHHSVNDMET
jgi:hypothetical protein